MQRGQQRVCVCYVCVLRVCPNAYSICVRVYKGHRRCTEDIQRGQQRVCVCV